MAIGAVFLALGLWSGVQLIHVLGADPEARWPDYLILIFPLLFLIGGVGGIFGLFPRRNVSGRRWSWKASALLWGALAGRNRSGVDRWRDRDRAVRVDLSHDRGKPGQTERLDPMATIPPKRTRRV
jgi:hypothetical protein